MFYYPHHSPMCGFSFWMHPNSSPLPLLLLSSHLLSSHLSSHLSSLISHLSSLIPSLISHLISHLSSHLSSLTSSLISSLVSSQLISYHLSSPKSQSQLKSLFCNRSHSIFLSILGQKCDYTGPQCFYREHDGYIWKWYTMGTSRDYTKSGFTHNKITLGLNICTQNMKITYENDIPWGRSRLPNIWIRRNYDYTGLNICTQNIKVTHGNNVPRGHIKITQNLDSQKKNITLDTGAQNIQITWTNDIPWGQIKMTNNLDSQKIQLHWVFNIFTRNMKIAYGNYIQWWHIKINQNLDSLETRLHGASGFFTQTHADYTWKWYPVGTDQD